MKDVTVNLRFWGPQDRVPCINPQPCLHQKLTVKSMPATNGSIFSLMFSKWITTLHIFSWIQKNNISCSQRNLKIYVLLVNDYFSLMNLKKCRINSFITTFNVKKSLCSSHNNYEAKQLHVLSIFQQFSCSKFI